MEENTKKKLFYVFMGIAVAALIVAIVGMCVLSIDINIEHKHIDDNKNIFTGEYTLFNLLDKMPKEFEAAINNQFSFENTYLTNFSEGINKLSTTGTIVGIVVIIIGIVLVIGGFAVRIFAKKRKIATVLLMAGFVTCIVGAIVYIIMLSNMNGDIQNAFRNGFIEIHKHNGSSYIEASKSVSELYNIHGSAGIATIIPLVGAALAVITCVIPFFKPFKQTDF